MPAANLARARGERGEQTTHTSVDERVVGNEADGGCGSCRRRGGGDGDGRFRACGHGHPSGPGEAASGSDASKRAVGLPLVQGRGPARPVRSQSRGTPTVPLWRGRCGRASLVADSSRHAPASLRRGRVPWPCTCHLSAARPPLAASRRGWHTRSTGRRTSSTLPRWWAGSLRT